MLAAELSTSSIALSDTEHCLPKYAAIDSAALGDNLIVAAVTGKRIRVLAAVLDASGNVNCRFESGAGGTALTGQMTFAVGTSVVFPFCQVGWFETAVGEALNLELSGAQSVDGCLVYIEV